MQIKTLDSCYCEKISSRCSRRWSEHFNSNKEFVLKFCTSSPFLQQPETIQEIEKNFKKKVKFDSNSNQKNFYFYYPHHLESLILIEDAKINFKFVSENNMRFVCERKLPVLAKYLRRCSNQKMMKSAMFVPTALFSIFSLLKKT